MAQNIYDDPAFFQGYSRLPRSVRGLDGAPEWPALRAMLPRLDGAQVVDLGCGFGWFARWARRSGAARVVAVDLSEKMLARARAESDDPAIEYKAGDLETLDLPTEAFDLAYSSLAFHYVADFRRLAQVIFRALRAGGDLVFSIEHPIYMAPREPGWIVGTDGGKRWPVERYAVEGPRTTDWLAPGVVKYHRTIGTTLTTLIETGFQLRRVVEWSPTAGQVAAQPSLAEEMERPMMLLVSVKKEIEGS